MTVHLGIVGTAGHIDHGKSALVLALTGVDPDRLAEEKARGITIELGFAELHLGEDASAGLVDVPGHESFVRTMVAGASGMDLGLLVVASDEGVMPQTTEHLAVLELLGVPRILVVLTKSDLVETDWLELVQGEVAELLDGTPYAASHVIATSVRSGEGLDELRVAIRQALEGRVRRSGDDIVRLPVDRSFLVRGTGRVVTGTLWSGKIAVGDRLHVRPGGGEVRVRGVEAHGRAVERADAGQRTALALTGPGAESVARGQILCDLGEWQASRRLTVWGEVLDGASPWTRGDRLRVHLGTAEVVGRVLPLGGPVLEPGQGGWLEIRLKTPLPARTGDRIVLRSLSPVRTVGGARVLEPHPPRRARKRPLPVGALEALSGGSEAERVRVVLERAGRDGVLRTLLPVLTGCTPSACDEAVRLEGAVERGRQVFPRGAVASAQAALLGWVDEQLSKDPLAPGAPPDPARVAAGGGPVAELALEALLTGRQLELADGLLRPPGYTVQPGERESARLAVVARVYEAAGLEPPAVGLAAQTAGEPDPWPLVRHLERVGQLVRLDTDLFIWAPVLAEVRRRVQEELAGRTGLGPMDFRGVIPVSRRHLLPILGYLDREGVTTRETDGRAVHRDLAGRESGS
ncbi:MAG: selenocysteine-specific translation elongation factor [Gemmatimonadota bacterium]